MSLPNCVGALTTVGGREGGGCEPEQRCVIVDTDREERLDSFSTVAATGSTSVVWSCVFRSSSRSAHVICVTGTGVCALSSGSEIIEQNMFYRCVYTAKPFVWSRPRHMGIVAAASLL